MAVRWFTVVGGGPRQWGAAPRGCGGSWGFGPSWVMTGRAHEPVGEGLGCGLGYVAAWACRQSKAQGRPVGRLVSKRKGIDFWKRDFGKTIQLDFGARNNWENPQKIPRNL
jgi:hypothetical protein